MDENKENKQHELEPIIEYEDCTNYVPSAAQAEYERQIQMRMRARRRAAERRRVNRNRTIAVILLLAIIFIIVKGCSKDDSPAADDSSSSASSSAAEASSDKKSEKKETGTSDKNGETDENTTSKGFKIQQSEGMTFVDGTLIVNKTYSLPADYDPGTSAVAQNAFDQMAADAMNDGVYLFVNSGYRSYDEQVTLYNSYAYERGTEEADKVSSRPGHSEHQTGLTFDVNSTEFSFEYTAEAKWLASHCADYGFIIRYPKGKEDITGYEYEPWHIRYLGVDLAKAVTESGLCLEEYFGITSDYADSEDNGEYSAFPGQSYSSSQQQQDNQNTDLYYGTNETDTADYGYDDNGGYADGNYDYNYGY